MTKVIPQIEKNSYAKPLSESLGRYLTADEMVRVFESINEYEHVFFDVESRAQLEEWLAKVSSKLELKPEKIPPVKGHNHPSIIVML